VTSASTAIDPITELFNRRATSNPGDPLNAVDPNTGPFAGLDPHGRRLACRPLFLGGGEVRRFEADLMAVTAILADLPRRLFDGDAERVCRALDLSPDQAALLGRLGARPTPPFGRVDAYHDGESIKILEFNASSDVGGLEWIGPATRALLEFDGFRSFADEYGLYYVDGEAMLTGALREAGHAVRPGAEPVIALIEGPGGLREYGHSWVKYQRVLRDRGLECHLGEISDLRFDGTGVRCGDARVDVVYRLFELAQVLGDPASLRLARQLRDAAAADRVALWTPLETEIHRNKRWMAYLSDPRLRTFLTGEERTLVDRVLPWTRALTPATPGSDPGLLDYCRANRERLVLKPDMGFNGRGVVFGWLTADRTWIAELNKAVRTGAVIQRRVVPRPEAVVDPGTGRTTLWDACLGLFWMPGGFAGGCARFVPSGALPTADEQTLISGVFLYPDEVLATA
jgi:hypothetical protein